MAAVDMCLNELRRDLLI